MAALVILRRMADGRSGRIPGFLRAAAARIAPGMTVLRSSEATAETLGASLAAWSCEIAMIILCARAIGLHVAPVLAVVVLLGINLAMAVPALPANAGTFESAAAVVLVFAKVGKPTAVAFALLYHLVQVVPVTLAGLGVLARSGFRLRPPEAPGADDLLDDRQTELAPDGEVVVADGERHQVGHPPVGGDRREGDRLAGDHAECRRQLPGQGQRQTRGRQIGGGDPPLDVDRLAVGAEARGWRRRAWPARRAASLARGGP